MSRFVTLKYDKEVDDERDAVAFDAEWEQPYSTDHEYSSLLHAARSGKVIMKG